MAERQTAEPQSKLSSLLQLEKRARLANSPAALFFLMVNETLSLVPYRQAFVWSAESKKAEAISGIPAPDANAPYLQWLKILGKDLYDPTATEPLEFSAIDCSSVVAEKWKEWLPQYGLWVPLSHPRFGSMGGFVLVREQPWTDADKSLLGFVTETYAHAWEALQQSNGQLGSFCRSLLQRRKTLFALALLLLVLTCLPVRLTALGEAEVMPRDPALLRSPLDGVIDQVLVQPNSPVKEGQALVQFDTQALHSRLMQAQKSRDVEKVKLQNTRQIVLGNMESAGQLAVIKAMIDERQAEVDYIKNMLSQATIEAPFDGIAIFEDKTELVGRPVRIGEKILSVARKSESRLRVWLSTNDAIALEPGARVRLFLNTDPDTPLEAILVSAGFTPLARPEGFMAYRLDARFDDENNSPRIGLRGVAKVYGEQRSLGYYLLRRPYSALRQWTGF